jgi:hypothetical protein
VTTISASKTRTPWPSRVQMEVAGRRLAVATAAGALSGLLVGGIGGRLAMMLLARLTPQATGITSDDGFLMGRFTLSGTLALLGVGTFLGVVGGGIYLVMRSLMIGPRWFQVLSISLGPAVVLGSSLVHSTGVDFILLRPTWLAIALFVTIPGLYAALLTILCERWLNPDGRFMQARSPLVFAPLVLSLAYPPGLLILLLGWLAVEWLRRNSSTRPLVKHPLVPWLARLALTVVFAMSLAGLIGSIAVLT